MNALKYRFWGIFLLWVISKDTHSTLRPCKGFDPLDPKGRTFTIEQSSTEIAPTGEHSLQ